MVYSHFYALVLSCSSILYTPDYIHSYTLYTQLNDVCNTDIAG